MTTRILDVRSADLLPRIPLPAVSEQARTPRKAESRQTQSQVQTLTQSQLQSMPSKPVEQNPFDSIQWMSVLKSLSAYQMYRQQVRLRVGGSDVVKFLLQDPSFPRAVSFCLQELEFCLRKLPKNAASLAAVDALKPVSYTHLDVYKRQSEGHQLHHHPNFERLSSSTPSVNSSSPTNPMPPCFPRQVLSLIHI